VAEAAHSHFTDEQRLAFGRIAELYDRARPSYPAAAIDALMGYGGLGPGSTIVEVGAGTGKATALLAARGLEVTAIEPSAEMARLARLNCAGHPGVEVVESDFESWSPQRRYAALVSVQAWHWVAPALRYVKAHQALAAGAALSAIWSLPDWERCAQRDQLRDAYRTVGVALPADFPMHPDSDPTRLAGHWEAEIEGAGLFVAPEVRLFEWRQDYASARYVELLQTHQDHILLGEGDRARLLAGVARAIDDAGGTLTLPLVTHVCLARRAQR
jgi:SAM-dependent methyltransferase